MGEQLEVESSENQYQFQKRDPTQKTTKIPESNDEQVLSFMDSLDSYISLIHSLTSILRQGWFDLASARYSMGASRVNGVLLDLKEHIAATCVEVGTSEVAEPCFTLCKWASVNAEDSRESKDGDNVLIHKSAIRQRHKDTSEPAEFKEDSSTIEGPSVNIFDQAQRERVKSLAVFGTLVSPKLRSSQSSFETALETLVEIANLRASMLSSFDKVRENSVDGDNVKS